MKKVLYSKAVLLIELEFSANLDTLMFNKEQQKSADG